MAVKSNETLKTKSGTYKSQIAASKKYDESVHNVRLRVPIDWWDMMQAHVDALPQYEVKGKDHHSVNAWLLDLIRREAKIDIENND